MTHTLTRSFSHVSHQSRSRFLVSNRHRYSRQVSSFSVSCHFPQSVNLYKLHTTLQSLTDKEAKLMTNIREGLTLPGLTNWYGLCNLFTYICYTYIWHLVHAVLLVVLHNSVRNISNHCLLDQLPRASLDVSSSTPHLQTHFK